MTHFLLINNLQALDSTPKAPHFYLDIDIRSYIQQLCCTKVEKDKLLG